MAIGGMTVAELRQRMSADEFMRWIVFLNERQRREEAAMKKAQTRRNARGAGRR